MLARTTAGARLWMADSGEGPAEMDATGGARPWRQRPMTIAQAAMHTSSRSVKAARMPLHGNEAVSVAGCDRGEARRGRTAGGAVFAQTHGAWSLWTHMGSGGNWDPGGCARCTSSAVRVLGLERNGGEWPDCWSRDT